MASRNNTETPTSHRISNENSNRIALLKRKRVELDDEERENINLFKRQKLFNQMLLNTNVNETINIEDANENVPPTIDLNKKHCSSPIWEYFVKHKDVPNKATCTICNQSIANNNGTTTMMIKHVKTSQKLFLKI